MKFEQYSYEKNGIKLEFKFPQDENLVANKKVFMELLVKAVEQLKSELKP